MAKVVWALIVDGPSHKGWVKELDPEAIWSPGNPGGWTFQDLGGDIRAEFRTKEEAYKALERFDASCKISGCYTHGTR